MSSLRIQHRATRQGLCRRLFITRAAQAAACAITPRWPVGIFLGNSLGGAALLFPRSARADPVTFAMAAASVVIGFIVRHNQADGGLGGMLTASLEYHRATLAGLGEVMAGVADLREKIADLGNRVSAVPQQTVEALVQTNLRTEVGVYASVMESHAKKGYQVWRVLQQHELIESWRGLGRAISAVETGPFSHPLTVTALLTAHNAHLAVGSALLFDKADLKVAATRCLRLYGKLTDAAVSGSTRAKLDVLVASRNAVLAELKALGFTPASGKPVAASQTIPLTAVSIQDFSPAVQLPSFCRLRNPRHPDFGEDCIARSQPSRTGNLEHFQHEVLVKAAEIVTPPQQVDQARRLVLYTAASELKTRSVAGPTVASTTHHYLAQTGEVRMQFARQPPHLAPAQARHQQLTARLDTLNQLSTQVLMHELALDSVLLNAKTIRQRFLEVT